MSASHDLAGAKSARVHQGRHGIYLHSTVLLAGCVVDHGDAPERQGVDQQGLASSSVIARWLQERRWPRAAKLVMMYVKQNRWETKRATCLI